MKNKLTNNIKALSLTFAIVLAFLSIGCGGKSGAIEDPVSYITPTIQNLQTKSTNIAKCTGGILSFTCDWTSPVQVNNANAYLSFVKTIDLPITEPIGVIGSATDMVTYNSSRAVLTNDNFGFDNSLRLATTPSKTPAVATETINDPEAIADFYRKFSTPILIPVTIKTDEVAGQFFAQVPFTTNDIASAPLGVHQMMLYMKINGYKTNTLSFELTFVP